MFKSGKRGGLAELSEKAPLEKVARFLAAQRWSMDIYRPDPVEPATQESRGRFAVRMAEFVDLHWREYIGPAQLLIKTCLKRPSRQILSQVCAETGAPENVALAIWDAGVTFTASDASLPPVVEREVVP